MSSSEVLKQKLRMIISHASGGHLSKPNDMDRSVNDICVEISRHHNLIWEQAKASRPSPTEAMVELKEAAFEFQCAVRRNASARTIDAADKRLTTALKSMEQGDA